MSSTFLYVIAQYSVTEHFKSSELGAVPGVFYFYDISPIKVRLLSFTGKLNKSVEVCTGSLCFYTLVCYCQAWHNSLGLSNKIYLLNISPYSE